MRILVTGGAGYIGSHTCLELLSAGHEVVVLDNLSNASAESLRRVEQLAGRPLPLQVLDLLDAPGVGRLFAEQRFEAVIHFAGLKAVGESVAQPLRYFQNNVAGTLVLLQCMQQYGVKRLVFSSSATVYGDPARVPVTEDLPLSATNPYGRSKLHIEEMCRDLARSDPSWRIALLRYFNPVGAHPSGRLGEDPRGVPNNLMPYLLHVATGRQPHLKVFGNDWPTPDGTGVRDYIHVVDLAKGHVAAVAKLESLDGCVALNLGTGKGISVLQMVAALSAACGRPLPYRFEPRRPGDVATTWADPSKAKQLLGWSAERGLEDMCADGWRWAEQNPNGY
ncbi:MAG: UDP-glucose 4-epimerase GalE [Archangiaceae bacterium]|nr:UDP-glucose 4-epimerase GalE [Archangiaceae bacterium]